MISPSAVTNYSNIFLFCFVFDILEPADRFISNYLQHYHQCKPISQSVLISALFASPSLLSSLPSPAPTLRVSTQSGRRNEDHEYREAAEDYPHYSEPDGRPSRFQCEFKVKPPPPRGSAARVVRSCSSGVCRVHRDCCISLIQKQTFCFLCGNKSLCRSFKDKCLG